jgi:hypothetical protein
MKVRTSFASRRYRSQPLLWGLPLGCLLALTLCGGCATQQSPKLPAVVACPPIPIPTVPKSPHVILPKPDAEGRYCLTQEQVDDLARGIRDLQVYSQQLAAAVQEYNTAQRQAAGLAK